MKSLISTGGIAVSIENETQTIVSVLPEEIQNPVKDLPANGPVTAAQAEAIAKDITTKINRGVSLYKFEKRVDELLGLKRI